MSKIISDKRFGRIIWPSIPAIIILFIVQTFASKCGSAVANLFDYKWIDQDDIFMRISVHHVIQMAIALLVIIILAKAKGIIFYLKPRFDKKGMLYTGIFSVGILIYVLISYIIGYHFHTIAPYEYELNSVNILGTLGFQLLLSGASEEVLFRALPIMVIGALSGCEKEKDYRFAIIVASLLFSVAHISWTVFPVALSFSWFQLGYAFLLGLIYGITYIKSKSIIYPMFMHGLSNFIMVGVGYIFATIR